MAPDSIFSTMGMAKARVFPDPVRDSARMSWPASASAMTRVWMGNGVVIRRAASALVTGADTPSSGKDFMDMRLLLLQPLDGCQRSGEVSLVAEPSSRRCRGSESSRGERGSPVLTEYQVGPGS